MAEIFSGLTGDGEVTLAATNFDGVIRVDVTDVADAIYFDALHTPVRYRGIGFVAFFENNPYSPTLTAGHYYTDPIWIPWVHFSEQSPHPNSVGGVDGFLYSFRNGVTATVAIGV